MRLLFVAAMLLVAGAVEAGKSVRGYVKQNGTYVAPSFRTKSNGTKLDNYSTKGNVNPYTGKKGTKSPWK